MKKILLSLLISFFSLQFLGQKDTLTIVLLHTNDMHGAIDMSPFIKFIIDEYKNKFEHVYLISAGDMFTGNPVVDKYNDPGYPMIDIMNKLDYKVSALGNHEFDYGQEILEMRFKQSNFQIICANINTNGSSYLKEIKPINVIKINDSVRIGFLGLIHRSDNGYPESHPDKLKNLKFEDPLNTIKKYKNYKDSFEIFIALSHCGIKVDEKIAKKYNIFDLIIGGHSHTVLENGKKINNTLIVQAGNRWKYVGVVILKYINNKIVEKISYLVKVKKTDNYDEEVANLVQFYNEKSGLNKVFTELGQSLVNKEELGNMITNAMLDTTKADIAIQNNGGIRIDSLPKGSLTFKQIMELQPFSNTLVITYLKPKQIKRLLAYMYNLSNENEAAVSGIIVEYKINSDKSLKKIKVYDSKGQKLENKKYKVVMNDYMVSAYKLNFLKKYSNTYIIDIDATMNYLRKNPNLNELKKVRVKIYE